MLDGWVRVRREEAYIADGAAGFGTVLTGLELKRI